MMMMMMMNANTRPKITVGINSTAAAAAITGGGVNPQGFLPTVSVAASKLAQATAADFAAGYTS
jgi:hypothetical protein